MSLALCPRLKLLNTSDLLRHKPTVMVALLPVYLLGHFPSLWHVQGGTAAGVFKVDAEQVKHTHHAQYNEPYYTHTHAHTLTPTHTVTCTHIYTHTCTHTHTHTYTHAHTHTPPHTTLSPPTLPPASHIHSKIFRPILSIKAMVRRLPGRLEMAVRNPSR